MNPINVIKTKVYLHGFKNFTNTRYGKKLKTLKDINCNKRCFIIGNGPSLSAEDLNKIHKNGDISFASNSVYKIFSSTDWRPTYYVCEDLLVLEDIYDKINSLDIKYKFSPIDTKWYHNIKINNAYYFPLTYKLHKEIPLSFTQDISKYVFCKGTVTTTCMQLAAYMGCKEIYLLGVDHSYKQTVDDNGNVSTDNSVTDYFTKDYAATMENKNIPNLQATTRSYQQAKEHCDNNNIMVYNATRGGKLEVFPRVNFDDLF